MPPAKQRAHATEPLEVAVSNALDELSKGLLDARLGRAAGAMFPEGYAAMALAHAELERALPGRGHGDRVQRDLGRAVDALGRGNVRPILFGGFTGLAWVAEYLHDEADGDANGEIDDALASFLGAGSKPSRRKWHETYDLIGGLVGYGLYALERLPRPSAAALLERIVEHLSAMSEPQPVGLSWRTQRAWARGPAQEIPFNLGLAHGVPGILGLLARVWRAGVAKREAGRLLERGMAWLLAQELPKESPSAFAVGAKRGVAFGPARSAWCYGDPGVAGALLLAAHASGDPAWKRAAIRAGARAAARDPATSGVIDAGLCHGAAGLAQIFARLHVGTGDERFATAAREWIARTLALRTPGHGIGGFRAWTVAPVTLKEPVRWRNDASFLNGSAGIAMALASFATKGSLAGEKHNGKKAENWAGWDRVLLLSDAP
jgi:hypothetical protein